MNSLADLTQKEISDIHKVVKFYTDRLPDREDLSQECWLYVLTYLPRFNRDRAGAMRYFKFPVREAIYRYINRDQKHGFTFRSGNRSASDCCLPEAGTKRNPRPGGSRQSLDSFDRDLQEPNEQCRRTLAKAEY